MPRLIVCGQKHLEAQCAAHSPVHVVSVLHPGQEIETPNGIDPARHWRIEFDDVVIERQGHQAVRPEDLRALLTWTATWPTDAPALVHCRHGIGRSMAIAYLILCQMNPHREEEVARFVRRSAPFATPNAKVVRLGAELLARPNVALGVKIMSVPSGGLPEPIAFPLLLPTHHAADAMLFPGG